MMTGNCQKKKELALEQRNLLLLLLESYFWMQTDSQIDSGFLPHHHV